MEKKNKTPFVIIITDEVGSTQQEKELLNKKYNNEICLQQYKKELLEKRRDLFTKQISGLKHPEKGYWTVIKTVGDSLIISLNPASEEELTNNLLECLYSLLEIWKKLNRKIRIACHLAFYEDVLTDKDDHLKVLKNYIEISKPKNDNFNLAPILSSIEWEIFGHAINLTARIASIPKEGLFLVSQEIMGKILSFNNLRPEIIPKEIPVELKLNSKNFGWAYPVPVINMKGINESYETPLYVWEIVPEKEINNKYKNLRVQFKEFQSLKIVIAGFNDPIEEKIPHPNEDDACNAFETKLKENPCPFFVDFVFKIKSQHQLFDPNMLRDFDNQLQKLKDKNLEWRDVLSEVRKKGDLIPYYLMFTSVPDIETNKKLREFFTPKNDKKKWYFQHISFDIYESLKIEHIQNNDKQERKSNRYFLLLFQIPKNYVDKADDLNRFFKKDKNGFSSDFTTAESHTYKTIAYGLIRGEIDGFILFYSKNNDDNTKKDVDAWKKYIKMNIIQNKFFSKTAPIFLYELELIDETFSPNEIEEKIKIFRTIREIHDKEKFN